MNHDGKYLNLYKVSSHLGEPHQFGLVDDLCHATLFPEHHCGFSRTGFRQIIFKDPHNRDDFYSQNWIKTFVSVETTITIIDDII